MRKRVREFVWSALTLAAVLSLTPCASLRAQAGESGAVEAQSNMDSSLGQVTVKNTSIVEFDTSHVRIAVDLTASPPRNVTVEGLRLTSLRLNGLPVYAQALTQPIELVKGKESALPPIYVTARVRDLTTVAPLRAMIEKQSVHVDGQVIAGIKMSFLEKLALHTEHPRISLPISQDVAVSVGSSPIERHAALGVITLIEVGLQSKAVAHAFESPWVRDLKAQANANLLQVETSYKLRQHDTDFPVITDQLGFRLSSGQIITTAEAREPWAYDTEFLGKIKSGEVKLDKKSLEVQLRSTNKQDTSAALQLGHGDFTLDVRGSSDKDDLIVRKSSKGPQDDPSKKDEHKKDEYAKVTVQRRASPNTLAVIALQAPPPPGGFHAAPMSVTVQSSWDKVALYRLILDAQNQPSIEVIEVSARRDGQGIHLDEPVDPSFYGSPIMVPEGVLGIVQDEQAGAFLPADIAMAAAATASSSVSVQPSDAPGR